MKKIILTALLFLICALPAFGQGQIYISRRPTVPASCDPYGLTGPALVWKTATTSDTCGTSKGLCECTAVDTWTFRTNVSNTGIVAKTFAYFNAGSALTSTAAPTNGQLLIGDTGNVPAVGTLTGTANETLITNGAHSITIGWAASVQHKAGANFLFTDTTDTTKKFQFDGSGVTTGTTRTITIPDSNTTLPIASQVLTFSGPTAARTFTLPDAATTLAGIATAQTLTNKTLTMGGGSTNQFSDSADATKTATLGLTNITTGTNRAINVPDAASTTVQARTAVDSLAVTGMSGTTGVQTTATFDQLLSTTAAVDMNTATPTTLYTSPSGRSTIIKSVTVRNCSTSITTASYSFGWTSAAFLDVIANATHTELTGATLGTSIAAKVGFTVGTSTGTFKVLMNTLQGGAATCTIDVWGYTF